MPFGAIGGGQFGTNPSRHGAELRLAGGEMLDGRKDIIVSITGRESSEDLFYRFQCRA